MSQFEILASTLTEKRHDRLKYTHYRESTLPMHSSTQKYNYKFNMTETKQSIKLSHPKLGSLTVVNVVSETLD